MKKLYVLVLLCYIAAAPLFSQAIRYEIKTKYNHTSAAVTADITVTVKEGDPGFTYYLMTNDPMKGDVLMQSEANAGKTYVFRDVKPGKYFVKIVNTQGLPAGKTVEIKENQTGKN
jgi:hypothetical protein